MTDVITVTDNTLVATDTVTETIEVGYIAQTVTSGGTGTPATTVTDETTYGIAKAVGASTNYARQDHTHGSPTAPTAASVGAATAAHNHTGTYDPAGTASSAVGAHAIATDPHGDRAYADTRAPLPVIGSVTADQPSTTLTLADITNLGLAITAGTWDFEFVIPYTGSVNTGSGINLDLTGPTNTLVSYTHQIQSGNGTYVELYRSTLSSAQAGGAITSNATTYTARIRGRIIATASGTLQARFALRDAATTTTVKAGAYGIARKVG